MKAKFEKFLIHFITLFLSFFLPGCFPFLLFLLFIPCIFSTYFLAFFLFFLLLIVPIFLLNCFISFLLFVFIHFSLSFSLYFFIPVLLHFTSLTPFFHPNGLSVFHNAFSFLFFLKTDAAHIYKYRVVATYLYYISFDFCSKIQIVKISLFRS